MAQCLLPQNFEKKSHPRKNSNTEHPSNPTSADYQGCIRKTVHLPDSCVDSAVFCPTDGLKKRSRSHSKFQQPVQLLLQDFEYCRMLLDLQDWDLIFERYYFKRYIFRRYIFKRYIFTRYIFKIFPDCELVTRYCAVYFQPGGSYSGICEVILAK